MGADSPEILQSLLDIGVDNSKMERYSCISYNQLQVLSLRFSTDAGDQSFIIVIVGIWIGLRCLLLTRRCMLESVDLRTRITENIERARRTMYSLRGYTERTPRTQKHLFMCIKITSSRFSYMEWKWSFLDRST